MTAEWVAGLGEGKCALVRFTSNASRGRYKPVKTNVLKAHAFELRLLMVLTDLAIVAVSGFMAHWVLHGVWEPSTDGRWFLVFAMVLTLLVFSHSSVYQVWRGRRLLEELRILSTAWAVVAGISITVLVTFFAAAGALRWAVMCMAVAWLGLLSARTLLRFVLRQMRKRGLNQRHVALVCMNDIAAQVTKNLRNSPWSGHNVVGYFDDRELPRESTEAPSLPRLGDVSELAEYVEKRNIDQVWLAYPLRAEDRTKAVVHALRHTTVDIRFVLDIFGFKLFNHSITEIEHIPVLNLNITPMAGGARLVKAFEDRVLSLLVLILIAPLMAIIAAGVKLSSPGPVFYRQERLSWNNRPFQMLKFRTMPVDSEDGSGPVWARRGDGRATTFGAFLRRTSLDELPQFINVLKGDMSIVGPRPERSVFVEQFKDKVPGYMKKHLVKGGITGWAQVNGWRGNTDLKKRIECDLYYIENWSIWFDLRIVLMTFIKGLINPNAY